MKFKILALLLTFASSTLYGFEEFCKGIPQWPKGSEVPEDAKYHDIGTVVKAEFAKEKWDMINSGSKNWVIVDARSEKDRAIGKIPKSIGLTADYNDEKLNDFTPEKVLKSVNKSLKTSFNSIAEMKDINFVVFCNGRKCHRTSFAGCELRRMGVAASQIHLMLDGIPAWQKNSYPMRD